MNSQVKECKLVSDRDHGLGAFATHRGSEATVEFDDDKLVKHLLQRGIVSRGKTFKRKDL